MFAITNVGNVRGPEITSEESEPNRKSLRVGELLAMSLALA